MAPTPLTATHRVNVKYIVDGKTHVLRHYVKRGADSGIGVPQLIDRDGSTLLDWLTCANQLWEPYSQIMNSGVDNPELSLWERSGVLWVPVVFDVAIDSGQSADPTTLSAGISLVLRATSFKKIRAMMLDTTLGYLGHWITGEDAPTAIRDIARAYNGIGGGDHDPYRWVVNKANNYLAFSGCVAGVTLDQNDRVKRSRGYE